MNSNLKLKINVQCKSNDAVTKKASRQQHKEHILQCSLKISVELNALSENRCNYQRLNEIKRME